MIAFIFRTIYMSSITVIVMVDGVYEASVLTSDSAPKVYLE